MQADSCLLRPGTLPVLPDSMVFPPCVNSYYHFNYFFAECQLKGKQGLLWGRKMLL